MSGYNYTKYINLETLSKEGLVALIALILNSYGKRLIVPITSILEQRKSISMIAYCYEDQFIIEAVPNKETKGD